MKNFNKIEGKILSAEENMELMKQLRNGNNSVREKLIVDNIGLIYITMSRIKYKEKDEMFQIGAEGLIKAVDLFDVNEGTSFNTYAAKCIEYRIYRGMRKSNAEKVQGRLFGYIEEVYKVTGKKPSVKEISEEFNMSIDSVDYLLHAALKPDSLDETVVNEEIPLSELIPDKTNVENYILNKVYTEQLLEFLTERNRKIVKRYYGIDCIPMNIVEIGKELGVTRSEISRTIIESCKKMQKLSNANVKFVSKSMLS